MRKPVLPCGKTGFLGAGGKPRKLENSLESLTWGETDALGGLDFDLLSALRIDACAGLAVDNLEGAESDQLEGFAFFDIRLDAVDHRTDDFLGVCLAGFLAEGFLHCFYELEFAAHGLYCLFGLWVGH